MRVKIPTLFIIHSALFILLLSGCFNEPEPAYKSVPAEARVYLSDRGLKDLSTVRDSLKAGAAIDYLNLDRNELETLPTEIAALEGLKWLRLNDNRLSELPALDQLRNLRRIYLRGNRFTAVPEALKNLPSLTDIDLSQNQIAEVPAWLAEKRGLENLSFSGTRITSLPEDLSAWAPTLISLQLGDLRLSKAEMARIRKALPKTRVVY